MPLITAYLQLCVGKNADIYRNEKVRGVHQLALANLSATESWLDVETLYLEAIHEIIGPECPGPLKDMILAIKEIAKESV
jgi:hypothetical protein